MGLAAGCSDQLSNPLRSSGAAFSSWASQSVLFRCSHENGKQRRDAGRQKHYRLELVARYPLHGVVEGMAVLKSKAPASQHDALMLTFK